MIRSLFTALAALPLVTGCAIMRGPEGPVALPPAATFTCCANPENYPDPLVQVGTALAPLVGSGPAAPERSGHILGFDSFWEGVWAKAQPGDILLSSNKNWFTGRLMPGMFSHSVIYTGTEAQLKALGVWDAPEVVPHHAAIRAGKVIIEAVAPAVHMIARERFINGDGAALLRPALGRDDRAAAVRATFRRVGAPYDYRFSMSSCDQLACTELMSQAMPEIGFTVRTLYGAPIILPDDIAAQAIRGERLALIDYAYGNPDRTVRGGADQMMADLIRVWGEPKPGPDPSFAGYTAPGSYCTAP